MPGPTIATALEQAHRQLQASSPSPRLDSELLLAHCLQTGRSHLIAWPQRRLDSDQQARFNALLQRRQRGEPMAYLLGEQEFWSLPLRITRDVLVPRPETETLVETALEHLPASPVTLADLGTGSGAIALALAHERPAARVIASDIAPAALSLARANAHRLGLGRVSFIRSHWLQAFADRCLHLIAANPPYVAEDDPALEAAVRQHEPRQALFAAEQGLAALREIATEARRCLHPGGWLVLEHGWQQADPVHTLLSGLGYRQIGRRADLAGQWRVSLGQWPG